MKNVMNSETLVYYQICPTIKNTDLFFEGKNCNKLKTV